MPSLRREFEANSFLWEEILEDTGTECEREGANIESVREQVAA